MRAFALLLAGLLAAPAWAAPVEPLRVGLDAGAPMAAVAFLRAELLAAGFSVEELASEARGDQLFARIRPDSRPLRAAAEISFATGPPVTIDLGPIAGPEEGTHLHATLAVQVSELLRARAHAPVRVAARPAPPPPHPPPPPPPPSWLRFDYTLSIGRSIAELGLAAGPGVGLSARHPRGFVVRAGLDSFFTPARLQAPEGDVSVTQFLLLVEAGYEHGGPRWRPAFTLGAGGQPTLAVGHARPGFVATTALAAPLVLAAGTSLGLRLTERSSLLAGVRAARLVGGPEIAIAGRTVAHSAALAVFFWMGLRLD